MALVQPATSESGRMYDRGRSSIPAVAPIFAAVTRDPSFEEQQLVQDAIARRQTPLRGDELRAEATIALSFLLACVALVGLAPPHWHGAEVGPAVACGVALAVAMNVRF